jgi:hypothetical protein
MFPQPDKRILVTNGRALYPNTISYTKNIDLREEGYIKLSPPQCRVYSSEDAADFNVPYELINRTSGVYKILTTGEDTYELSLSTAGVGTIDSTFAGGTTGLRVVRWVSNLWFINADNAVYSYDGSSASSTYTSRIATVLNFIALFVSRNTLVGRDASNVNVLKQYNTSYSGTTDLTLPANFAITGCAFSNEQMGVITKQRKNQGNAIFAIWDGADTSANRIFELNDPYILDIAAYKGSWVILTSRGLLLFFNGGGFDELARLPGFDLEHRIVDVAPDDGLNFAPIISVNGDRIYVNVYSLPESTRSMKPYVPFYSGGAYCYDPRNGLYHIAAPSYSKYDTYSVTFANNIGTAPSAHYLETGDEVWPAASSNEITAGKTYYVIKLTDMTFKLAETYDDAIAEEGMTITNASYDLFYVNRYDYGIEILKQADCGLVRNEQDLSGYTTSGAFPFFLGANVHPNNLAATRVAALTMSIPVMHNRGYFVLGKFQTQNLQDSWQAIAVKYAKLKNGDQIIVKAKTKDTEPIIVGDPSLFATSAYTGKGALWDSSGTYFTTTEDLTGASEGDEVHIFAGPGAGQSAHIVTINGNATDGFEVVLDERIRGVVSGRVSCVSIDKFKKCGVITKDDTDGVKSVPVGDPGTAMDVKIELRGIGTKVSEIIPISGPHQQAI